MHSPDRIPQDPEDPEEEALQRRSSLPKITKEAHRSSHKKKKRRPCRTPPSKHREGLAARRNFAANRHDHSQVNGSREEYRTSTRLGAPYYNKVQHYTKIYVQEHCTKNQDYMRTRWGRN